MITDSITCGCGAQFFPTLTRWDKCRACAKASTRIQPATHVIDGEMIIDEFDSGEPRYLPTPEEIEAVTAQIRSTWTPRDWRQAIRGNRGED